MLLRVQIIISYVYALPIIVNAASNGDTTQAIIKDYQGAQNIKYVTVTFKEKTNTGLYADIELFMYKIKLYTLLEVYLPNLDLRNGSNSVSLYASSPQTRHFLSGSDISWSIVLYIGNL